MTRYERITDATTEPVSLSEACAHLRVESSEDHGYIASLIRAARVSLERRYSRQLVTATWKAYLDSFPAEIWLERLPVLAVSSITYVDTGGTTQTLDTAAYQVDANDPDRPARIAPAYGYTWPSTRGETYSQVTVTFTAGYGAAADVPQDVKLWILATVAMWYRFREPVISGTIATKLPEHLDGLLLALDWGQYS